MQLDITFKKLITFYVANCIFVNFTCHDQTSKKQTENIERYKKDAYFTENIFCKINNLFLIIDHKILMIGVNKYELKYLQSIQSNTCFKYM